MGSSPVMRWLAVALCFSLAYAGFKVWRVHQDEQEYAAALARDAAGQAAAEAQPADAAGQAAAEAQPADAAGAEQPAEFTLTDEHGQPFDSHSLAGQVWVGSFFFTNCPAMCWRQNQALAALQETNPDSRVKFVSITCDPENDTPEVLHRYAERFHADPARWTFLTGDMRSIVRIGRETFKVSVEKGTHSDRAFVVDRDGRVRGRFRVTEPDQVEKLKLLLAQLDAAPAGTAAAESP